MSFRRDGISLVERGAAIDAHWLAWVSVALVKAKVVVAWHVPVASQSVVNVLTLGLGDVVDAAAASEAKFLRRHEVGPLVDLLVRSISIGIDETANWVSVSCRAV